MQKVPLKKTELPIKKTIVWENVKPDKPKDEPVNQWKWLVVGVAVGIEVTIHLRWVFPDMINFLAGIVGGILN